MMKKFLFLFVLSLGSIAAWAQDQYYDFSDSSTGQTLYYNIISSEDLTVEVTHPGQHYWEGFNIPSGALTIPSTVEYNNGTYSVTAIGRIAFHGCAGLTSVTIPNSVTTIGEWAFKSCSGLPSVTIPNSVTTIEKYAFESCTGLTSVVIGNSVTTIGKYAFAYCTGLTSIVIGNSVTTIGENAFEYCSGLTYVVIPNSVTTIGRGAFEFCSGLTFIVIGSSVGKDGIENNAFYDCTNLKTVYWFPHRSLSPSSFIDQYMSGRGDVKRVVSEFQIFGSGDNTIYRLPNRLYSISDDEDLMPNHIPYSSLPTNFIGWDGTKWVAREVVLTDGQATFLAQDTVTAGTATYTRNYTQDNRSTLCLPFKPTSVTPAGDLKFYEFSNFDGTTISFSEVAFTNLQANTPYMVEWPATKTKADFVFSATDATFPATGDAASRTVTHVTQDDSFVGKFVGTMTRTCMTSSNYGYSNGFFVQSAEGTPDVHTSHAHVNPFRAYFEITSGSGVQSLPPTLSVEFSEGDNIAIEEPQGPAQQSSSIRYSKDVYDLMGRRVRKNAENLDGLPRGIYIWKGKKVLHFQ